jgi:hypothetical protein
VPPCRHPPPPPPPSSCAARRGSRRPSAPTSGAGPAGIACKTAQHQPRQHSRHSSASAPATPHFSPVSSLVASPIAPRRAVCKPGGLCTRHRALLGRSLSAQKRERARAYAVFNVRHIACDILRATYWRHLYKVAFPARNRHDYYDHARLVLVRRITMMTITTSHCSYFCCCLHSGARAKGKTGATPAVWRMCVTKTRGKRRERNSRKKVAIKMHSESTRNLCRDCPRHTCATHSNGTHN